MSFNLFLLSLAFHEFPVKIQFTLSSAHLFCNHTSRKKKHLQIVSLLLARKFLETVS